MSAARALTKLEVEMKILMKSQLEVELNEFFQQQIESEVFEGVDENEKARFIGSFFRWVRNLFNEKREPDLPSVIKSSLIEEGHVASPLEHAEEDKTQIKPIPEKKVAQKSSIQTVVPEKKVEHLNLAGKSMTEAAKNNTRSQIFGEPLPEVKQTVGNDIAAWTKEHEKKQEPVTTQRPEISKVKSEPVESKKA